MAPILSGTQSARLPVILLASLLALALGLRTAGAETAEILQFPAVGPFNGYNAHINVLECLNLGETTAEFDVALYRSSGEYITSRVAAVARSGSAHLILNEFADSSDNGITNDHGLVRLSLRSPTPAPRIACIVVFYRMQDPAHPPVYAFSIPIRRPLTGRTYGMYNSFYPGADSVTATENWLSILNPGDRAFRANVLRYDQSGELESTRPVSLEPGTRIDFALGHEEGQVTGLYEIEPEDPAQPYGSFLARYHRKSTEDFTFAFSLATHSAQCNAQLPASTMGHAVNWLEIGNPSNNPKQVLVEVRDRAGLPLASTMRIVPAHGQDNIYLNSHIDPTDTGNVGIVSISCPEGDIPMLLQSSFYGRSNRSAQDIAWAYATQAVPAERNGKVCEYSVFANTYLQAANWLKLLQSSAVSAALSLTVYTETGAAQASDTTTVPALGGIDYPLHERFSPDSIGSLGAKPTANVDQISASLTGQLLRVYPAQGGSLAAIMPTPLVAVREQDLPDGATCAGFGVSVLTPIARSETVECVENQETQITLQAEDPRGLSLSFTITSGTAHGTLSGTPPNLTYQPGSFVGTDVLRFTVDNGSQTSAEAQITIHVSAEFAGIAGSLAPYRNTISEPETRSLLRKAALGGSEELVQLALSQGLNALVDALLVDQTPQWVDEQALNRSRLELEDTPAAGEDKSEWTLNAGRYYWYTHLRYGNPLKERLALLWHDHFATSLAAYSSHAQRHHYIPDHIDVLQRNALGSFEQLVADMHWDGAMNVWLDNITNKYYAPNENFGRELLELFILGARDPITGLTNYTEDDVIYGSTRAVSGFQIHDFSAPYVSAISWSPGLWMPDPKHPDNLPVFRGKSFEANYPFDYETFAPYVLYSHPGAARHIGAKLYSTLVDPNPSEAVTAELAAKLIETGFELEPVLRMLLRSSAMFTAPAEKQCIVSPAEQLFSFMRSLNLPLARSSANPTNDTYPWVRDALVDTGQDVLNPPSVFGWKGCGVNRDKLINRGERWLSPQLMLERSRNFTDLLNEVDVLTQDSSKPVQFTWQTLLPSPNATAGETLDYIADAVGVELPQNERSLLLDYLTTVKDDSYPAQGAITVVWGAQNPAFNDLLRLKLPGLLEILFSHMQTNLK